MPKKKLAFTRTIRWKKSSLQSDNNDEEHTSPAMADTDTAGSHHNITTHHGASQKPSIAELTGELKRNHDELASACSELAAQKKEVELLKKRNKLLTDASMKARTDLREERKQSTVLDGRYKKMMSEERKQSAELDDHYKKGFMHWKRVHGMPKPGQFHFTRAS